MNQDELNFVLKWNDYSEGGTKQACVKVKEFLRHASIKEQDVHSVSSCVTAEEFVKSVEILMAFAFQHEDEIPERWACDSDCHKVSSLLCLGEFNISKDSKKLCPYFQDEGFI